MKRSVTLCGLVLLLFGSTWWMEKVTDPEYQGKPR